MDNFTTIIGKDVIESLTIGMYEDSRFIFREYIQNSADQIDKAKNSGIIDNFYIHIFIDKKNETIIFEDNATGIELSKVLPILKNIASSTKKRGVDKGFRGIGRLGGLGYCNELIFETTYRGENKKSILNWDASLLKKIINNRDKNEEAISVIDEITSLQIEDEEKEKAYFKVILKGVSNENLLNIDEVRKYLSLVAPVPFKKQFIYEKKISEELLKEGLAIDEYKIFINSEQLFKGYSTIIYDGNEMKKTKFADIIDVEFFKAVDNKKNILYWGWYGVADKLQSLNQINYCRGFRLRKSNIQIGDEYTLTRFHKDKRFQNYFIGEVHAFNKELIPNARRDYFSENNECNHFEEKIKEFFLGTIHKLCYKASEISSATKKIENFNKTQKEFADKVVAGFTNNEEKKKLTEELDKKKKDAEVAKEKLKKIEEEVKDSNSPVEKIINKVELNKKNIDETLVSEDVNSKTKYKSDELSKLPRDQKKLMSKVFSIIKNVLPNETAENLIKKLIEELK